MTLSSAYWSVIQLYDGRVKPATLEDRQMDANIYLVDGAYEPSFVGAIAAGEWEGFDPTTVSHAVACCVECRLRG